MIHAYVVTGPKHHTVEYEERHAIWAANNCTGRDGRVFLHHVPMDHDGSIPDDAESGELVYDRNDTVAKGVRITSIEQVTKWNGEVKLQFIYQNGDGRDYSRISMPAMSGG